MLDAFLSFWGSWSACISRSSCHVADPGMRRPPALQAGMPAPDVDAAFGFILELLFLENSRPIVKAVQALCRKLLPRDAPSRLAAVLLPRIQKELQAAEGSATTQVRIDVSPRSWLERSQMLFCCQKYMVKRDCQRHGQPRCVPYH